MSLQIRSLSPIKKLCIMFMLLTHVLQNHITTLAVMALYFFIPLVPNINVADHNCESVTPTQLGQDFDNDDGDSDGPFNVQPSTSILQIFWWKETQPNINKWAFTNLEPHCPSFPSIHLREMVTWRLYLQTSQDNDAHDTSCKAYMKFFY